LCEILSLISKFHRKILIQLTQKNPLVSSKKRSIFTKRETTKINNRKDEFRERSQIKSTTTYP
jgi:hypothetical protein